MKIKLEYRRPDGGPVDIAAVTDATATIGDIAEEIVATDPAAPRFAGRSRLTLAVAPPGSETFRQLDPDRAVGEVQIASGWTVRPEPAAAAGAAPDGDVQVRIMVDSGAQEGATATFGRGSHLIGRDPSSDFVIADPLVSKRHARLEVGETVELVDLNSANGIMVDGGLVQRLRVIDDQPIELGDTVVSFRVQSAASVTDATRIVGAAIPFNRSPRVEERYVGTEYPGPVVPKETEKPVFPWLLMLAPVVLGLVMFLATRNPLSMLFIAMSPMMMIANYSMSRKRLARRRDSEIGLFEAQYAALDEELTAQIPVERSVRDKEAPHVDRVVEAMRTGSDLMWTRRPEHWTFLAVRLGLGRAPSRNRVVDEGEASNGLPEYHRKLEELIDRYRMIDEVPIVEDPVVAGAMGVVGDAETAHGFVRSLLMQWVGLHSPAELVVAALAAPRETPDLEWLKWLPHTSSPFSPLAGQHLADSAANAALLLAQLEELVDTRIAAAGLDDEPRPALEADPRAMTAGMRVGEEQDEFVTPPLPVVLVLATEDAPVDPGRLSQLIERSITAGVVPVFVAAQPHGLPAACRTFVDLREGLDAATVNYVRHGQRVTDVRADVVARETAMEVARTLSGVVDRGAVVADATDLPTNVPMLSLLGEGMADSATAVVDRWRQNFSIKESGAQRPKGRAGTLRALVGQSGADAMHLDLRAQGPHALVGGTTGAGKSEFLQAWVLGMAAEYSPDRVTFLFVDYKGGAAFAECVKLPHCVGLVTDLSPHLVRRALTSLRAELRHREHVLNQKKAKDLIELEKRGDPDCPPALVLVIDEFAALVGEVPEFVDGVVDIAQRGRSLGIHLIMATQRPAGVIKDNLRANTNLRVALRMADEIDSADVVGTKLAASFDPALPGRALAKTGPGRLVLFQSAYAGGWSETGAVKPTTHVHEHRFGAEVRWERPESGIVVERDPGPTDLARLVSAIDGAAGAVPITPPRRPWLNELERIYDLAGIGPQTDTELVLGIADLPDSQQQLPLSFRPDTDGHLIVYGTGGSGKSVTLRTLAASAGITPLGGPVEVFGLDFASGGLRMLEALPHVGSVIPGEDGERTIRLLRNLRAELDRRGREYSQLSADSLTSYRTLAGRPDEPRILLLVDGFPAFRTEYEGASGRAAWYSVFQQLLTEGRQLGIHVVLTADRPSGVPGAIASSVPRRVVLRLAEETMYGVLDVPADILGPDAPPGRAIIDGAEVQIAVLGGSASGAEQSEKLAQLGRAMRSTGRRPVDPIAALPDDIDAATLPDDVDGLPVLGISDVDLAPIGFTPEGTFLLGGPPGSGRTTALLAMTRALARRYPDGRRYYFSARRSAVAAEPGWTEAVIGIEESAETARALMETLPQTEPGGEPVCVVVEALADFLSTPADGAIVDLVKAVRRTGNFVLAESETSTWGSSWPLFAEIKSGRKGVLLQPDPIEGDTLLKASLPRASRTEFPPGRGYLIQAGKVTRVQVANA